MSHPFASRFKSWQLATLTAACFACSSQDATPSGAVRGELVVYVADLDDGTSQQQYFLRVKDGELAEQRLWFATDPELESGAVVDIWGIEQRDGIRVSQYVPVSSPIGTRQQALVDAPPYPDRRFAFVRVDIGGGIDLTEEEARRRLFGTAPDDGSLKQYFDEVSYGTQGIVGDVYGPFQYTMTGCDTRELATTLKPQLPDTFDHYLWYLGSRNGGCNWSGLAESGEPDDPSNDTWYNARSGCVVLAQEPGHNFGMRHSSWLDCGDAPFADEPDVACEHDEYGDPYDPMGSGCRHMNAYQKVYQSWLQRCNAVRVTASDSFTLLPLEIECDGIQVLQIPMPKQRPFTHDRTDVLGYYYLELRTAVGFDANIRVAPEVLVHVAEDFRDRTQRGRNTWILDMDPSTSTMDGLDAGESYTDPAGGVRFEVVSIDSERATIQVDIDAVLDGGSTAPTCLDGSTLAAPGPSGCLPPPDGAGGAAGSSGADAGGGNSAAGAAGASATVAGAGGGAPLAGTGGIGTTSLDTDRPKNDVEGSCACRTAAANRPTAGALGALLALILAGLARARRRVGV
jgi:hypothetical protein